MKKSNDNILSFLPGLLAKTLALVAGLLCVFFIIYPQSCKNFVLQLEAPDIKGGEEVESKLALAPTKKEISSDKEAGQYRIASFEGVYIDDNPFPRLRDLPREDFEYLVVKRYVTLEDRYLAFHPNDKDAAQAIGEQVMLDAAISEPDWDEIMIKAVEKGWFDKARQELASEKLNRI